MTHDVGDFATQVKLADSVDAGLTDAVIMAAGELTSSGWATNSGSGEPHAVMTQPISATATSTRLALQHAACVPPTPFCVCSRANATVSKTGVRWPRSPGSIAFIVSLLIARCRWPESGQPGNLALRYSFEGFHRAVLHGTMTVLVGDGSLSAFAWHDDGRFIALFCVFRTPIILFQVSEI